MAVDGTVADDAVVRVGAVDQGVAAQHLAVAPRQRGQQAELGARELHGVAEQRRRLRVQVHRQRPDDDLVRLRLGERVEAAEVRLHPRHQFARVEGLGHVVVAAHFQADHPVHLRVLGGKQQDRHPVAAHRPAAQGAADVQPVHLRHEDVEDQEIGLAPLDVVERFDAVAGFVHLEAGSAQGEADHLADVRVVVHHEDVAHDAHSTPRDGAAFGALNALLDFCAVRCRPCGNACALVGDWA